MLEIKITKERIKEELEEFEIKRLEIETEIRMKILKQTEKAVRINIEEIKKSELELKEQEIKEIMQTTTQKELEELETKRINKIESYCPKFSFESIISF